VPAAPSAARAHSSCHTSTARCSTISYLTHPRPDDHGTVLGRLVLVAPTKGEEQAARLRLLLLVPHEAYAPSSSSSILQKASTFASRSSLTFDSRFTAAAARASARLASPLCSCGPPKLPYSSKAEEQTP